jgi:6-phosphogluconolactonase
MKKTLALLLVIVSLIVPNVFADSDSLWVYIGTYTGPKSKGIYVMKMDAATGQLSEPRVAAEVANPSFLTLHPSHKFLYAVSEGGGKDGGVVSAFSIAPETGLLTLLNQQTSGGDGPCFVGLDPAGKMALVANYGSGSFESLPIGEDGKLGVPSTKIQDAGAGPNSKRQQGPHAHSINSDAAGRFAVAADLGLDKLFIFRLDPLAATLTPNDPPFFHTAPGAGPRHFTFHPGGKFAYVINELNSTVTALAYDAEKGALSELQTLTTLPADFHDNNSTAEVQVHPSGKFLYGSNRGHDSLAAFSIDERTGKLTPIGHYPTLGKTPRNFRMDPAGNFLLAAHQGSDSVVAFKVDLKTGALTPTGQSVSMGQPVCVKFVSMK